jgi:phospholipid/cholesterol/gamma-HCH transport system substrate-binding protein
MNKSHNYFDFLIGTIVLLFAIGFFTYSFKSSKISSNNGYDIFAKFDNADGITIGSDIKIAGIKIGSIIEQNLDEKTSKANLKMNISSTVKIPADSSAKIVSEGLLGAKYISISLGGDEEILQNGQEISFTQSSLNFEELLGKFIFSDKKEKGNDNEKN